MSTPAWAALPQPTSLEITGGLWRPRAVRVETAGRARTDPGAQREAERLAAELDALGIPVAPDAATCVTLRLGEGAGEGFELRVEDDVEVTAATAAGLFRATRQLLHNLRAHNAVPRAVVRSRPAVGERGLHLDAARKHVDAAWIAELLHDLADVGIDTFQWHFSENEGFRLECATFPEIVSAERVTTAEARELLALARDLHIRVVPSLDMPGHLRHALAAHPDLRLPPAATPELPTEHALDITNPEAVRFALALVDEFTELFSASTVWNLGGDEFVDFDRMDDYPALAEGAVAAHGAGATGFDLLTAFVDTVAARVRDAGFTPRVWNDGMLRGAAVPLDADVQLAWWTNWNRSMRPLTAALEAGHDVVNLHDGLFYYVLGENAGYRYPTSERIWEADWHPGLFPSLPDGTRQEIPSPYPEQLLGASFAVWADRPDAQTPEQIAEGIRRPLRALAERARNGGSRLSHDEFAALDAAIGRAR
ncbi:family 20 glycosylhydrolase [Brachybacterium huguangmaarense]|uniref:Family 20 glycosylhydrolase n=1 Tax=Brachybacterium huguangmaarense TaxID=1652028 RepID=A0ABY6G4W2_9MICO|nr:family 20 glycosylhydrolase [Brachybacterium huguangmaarense]UYG18152.1 family 20 glycosylhydrolase [Brachybacterium huguangmaarense]